MFPFSTPTHIFRLPIETDTIAKLEIVYVQFGKTVIEKNENDVQKEGNTISLKLTQQETRDFSHTSPVRIQLRVLTKSGDLLPSKIIEKEVEEVLSKKVLE